MEALVIRGVRAMFPGGIWDQAIDVIVERGVITKAGPAAAASFLAGVGTGDRVRIVDAAEMWLLPGMCDLHAHLREPGQEYKEDIRTGLEAAALGGFTDVCVMPNTRPVNDTRAVTEMMVARAREVNSARLHPIGAITVGQKGESLTEMADLRDAGAVGVSDDGYCVTSSAVMRRALEYAKTFDLPVIQHAEDHALTAGAEMHEGSVSARLGLRGWPRVAEDIIVARDLILAEYTGAKYHLAHMSTMGSARLVREAKSRGLGVTCEVTPHHLLLTHENVLGYDTACKVNPPLREAEDVAALREALRDGTIDCIATDHAPHSVLEKDTTFAEASPGMIGLELCLPLLLELAEKGELPTLRVIEALTHAPRKVVGLPRVSLREGADANLVLWDPRIRTEVSAETIHSKSKNTPFLGKTVRGRVVMNLLGSNMLVDRFGATDATGATEAANRREGGKSS